MLDCEYIIFFFLFCFFFVVFVVFLFFFFQAEDGIRDLVRSRGLGDVYKRQLVALFVLAYALLHWLWAVPAWDRYLLPVLPIVAALLGRGVAAVWGCLL